MKILMELDLFRNICGYYVDGKFSYEAIIHLYHELSRENVEIDLQETLKREYAEFKTESEACESLKILNPFELHEKYAITILGNKNVLIYDETGKL